jgi:hypothetical protein
MSAVERGGEAMDHRGQQGEARFVYQNGGAPLASRPLKVSAGSQRRLGFGPPLLDCGFVALIRAAQ